MSTGQLFGDDFALEQHEIHIECNFMFLNTAKQIWKAIRGTYSTKKNTRVFEVYEDLFSLQQDNKSLEDTTTTTFKSMINKLNQYHPVTNDIEVLKKQHEKHVYKFLSGLNSRLKPLREQLLARERGDSLSAEYFLDMHNFIYHFHIL